MWNTQKEGNIQEFNPAELQLSDSKTLLKF